jgi:KUP system potassium uptake protein
MIMVTIMLTWHKGRELVFDNLKSHLIHFLISSKFAEHFASPGPGTAVFFRAEVTACRMP